MRLPLEHVATQGRVKDVYPLADAQTGEMHLTLEWAAIDLGGGAAEGSESGAAVVEVAGAAGQ